MAIITGWTIEGGQSDATIDAVTGEAHLTNTGFTDLVYTIKYDNGDGCSGKTTYTVTAKTFTAVLVSTSSTVDIRFNDDESESNFNCNSDEVVISGRSFARDDGGGNTFVPPLINKDRDISQWSVTSANTGTTYTIKIKFSGEYSGSSPCTYTIMNPNGSLDDKLDVTVQLRVPTIKVRLWKESESETSFTVKCKVQKGIKPDTRLNVSTSEMEVEAYATQGDVCPCYGSGHWDYSYFAKSIFLDSFTNGFSWTFPVTGYPYICEGGTYLEVAERYTSIPNPAWNCGGVNPCNLRGIKYNYKLVNESPPTN